MKNAISLLLCALYLASCAEMVEAPVVADATGVTREQAVVVVPEYSIEGLESLPEGLFLTSLGFTVSEIRLEPLTGGAGVVAFSAVKPEHVNFDVSRAQTIRFGEPITLPQPGRYLVSLRLEPLKFVSEGGDVSRESSFSVQGFVAQTTAQAEYLDEDPDRKIGPIPVPISDETMQDAEFSDEAGGLRAWTPFSYNSERAVFFTMNEIELGAGRQQLSFSFSLQNWAVDVMGPLSTAVSDIDTLTGRAEGVDVSRQLDSKGHGPEDFVGRGVASTMRF